MKGGLIRARTTPNKRIPMPPQGGGSFVDLDFPPVPESIAGAICVASGSISGVDAAASAPGVEASSSWRRPKEFLPPGDEARVFVDGLTPGDVMQGALGNCWFMCVYN